MNDTTAGQLIKSKLKKIGISEQDLEKKLKLKSGYISQIESGEMHWDWLCEDRLIEIADALWLDSDNLLISSGIIPKRVKEVINNNTRCMEILKSYIEQIESRNAPIKNKSKAGVK